jgi:hypothetical protein
MSGIFCAGQTCQSFAKTLMAEAGQLLWRSSILSDQSRALLFGFTFEALQLVHLEA